jgi:hypothetical protein
LSQGLASAQPDMRSYAAAVYEPIPIQMCKSAELTGTAVADAEVPFGKDANGERPGAVLLWRGAVPVHCVVVQHMEKAPEHAAAEAAAGLLAG